MKHSMLTQTLVAAALTMPPALSGQPAHPPAVDLEAMLDTFFNNSNGIMRFDEYVIAFAPPGSITGKVVVMNEARRVVAEFPFFQEYRNTDGVFARAAVQGPADITLSEPGTYNLLFTVGGTPVSRLPFVVQKSVGGDPLNPKTSYRLRGLWSQMGHLTMRTARDQQIPVLSLWLGSNDLPEGAARGMFTARLFRGGRLVATSKRSQGEIFAGHYKRTTIDLYHPHEERQAQNAQPFTLADWTQSGSYELRISRQSDDALLRSFPYTAAGGAIVPLPQTALSHEPTLDYITPRIARKNTNTFEIIETIWLRSK
jgi:hypothetical protein